MPTWDVGAEAVLEWTKAAATDQYFEDRDPVLCVTKTNLNVASGAHLIVFASGKDRRNPVGPLHANFQLDKGGEYLALVGPGPVVLQAFDPFPAQQRDVTYGILGGDPATLRPLGVPTPGVRRRR